ncbi:MAG: hypothetical protein M1815_003918, partial [Lichina confinis]
PAFGSRRAYPTYACASGYAPPAPSVHARCKSPPQPATARHSPTGDGPDLSRPPVAVIG